MGDIEKILAEREKTHGDFTEHSAISQGLKRALFANPKAAALSDVKREALELVCHKLARIVAGDSNHVDSYVDICGYITLALREVEGNQNRKEAESVKS